MTRSVAAAELVPRSRRRGACAPAGRRAAPAASTLRSARARRARARARAGQHRLRDDGRLRRAAARPAGIGHGATASRSSPDPSSPRGCCSGGSPTSDRRRGARAFGAGLVAGPWGSSLVGAAQSLPAALAAAVVMGTGMSLLFPSLALLVIAPRRRRAPRRGDSARSPRSSISASGSARRWRGSWPRSAGARTTPPRSTRRRLLPGGALLGWFSSRGMPRAVLA